MDCELIWLKSSRWFICLSLLAIALCLQDFSLSFPALRAISQCAFNSWHQQQIPQCKIQTGILHDPTQENPDRCHEVILGWGSECQSTCQQQQQQQQIVEWILSRSSADQFCGVSKKFRQSCQILSWMWQPFCPAGYPVLLWVRCKTSILLGCHKRFKQCAFRTRTWQKCHYFLQCEFKINTLKLKRLFIVCQGENLRLPLPV